MAFISGLDGVDFTSLVGAEFTDSQSDVGGPSARSWRDLAEARPDPLMQMDWDVLFKPPAGVIALGGEYVEEIHVPMPKFDSDSVTYQARKYYYAKFEEFGVASSKLYEDSRMNATRFLRSWQSRIKDDKGNYRVPRAYKGTIFVWPRNAQQTNIAQIELVGVFPTVVPNLPFTSSSDRTALDVEWSVDNVKITFI